MMNTNLMSRIADAIEAEPRAYRQYRFGLSHPFTGEPVPPACDTPACVAGWACWLEDGGAPCPDARHGISGRAEVLLDLTNEDACMLFAASWPVAWADRAGVRVAPPQVVRGRFGAPPAGRFFRPDAKQAVPILRRMAADGTVPAGRGHDGGS